MTNIVGSAGAQNTNVVSTPSIDNFTTGLANVEQPYSFPAGTKRFSLKNRGAGLLKISYTLGESATKYWTIPPACSYDETEINVNTQIILYMQSPIAAQTLEVISWS